MAKTPISTSCLSVAGGSFRIPPPHEGLQVNSCRNPECSNFGVEALAQVTRGRPKAGSAGAGTDLYTLSGHKGITPDSFLKCRACNRTLSVKSNRAIAEELERISMYLHPRPLEDVCRTSGCENGLYSVTDHPDRYASQGARGKSHRYRCKSCKKTFSVSQAAHLRQRAPHENKTIFKELVSKKPIRGIVEMTELGAAAVYGKIDFIYRQCLGFAGERERKLQSLERKHVRICVDRQDYMVNWRRRQDRKNVQMSAVCTVDYDSGYVLGHHLNYDPDRDQEELDDLAGANGDMDPTTRSYFRTFPQYWVSQEFYSSVDTSLPPIRPDLDSAPLLVDDLIRERERQRRKLKDAEKDDVPTTGSKLPQEGAMGSGQNMGVMRPFCCLRRSADHRELRPL
jgi:transposase-like protein